jgi:hypothetical protein
MYIYQVEMFKVLTSSQLADNLNTYEINEQQFDFN